MDRFGNIHPGILVTDVIPWVPNFIQNEGHIESYEPLVMGTDGGCWRLNDKLDNIFISLQHASIYSEPPAGR